MPRSFDSAKASILDWLTLRRQVAETRRTVREQEVKLDSLERLAHALETDPVAQERAAREQFGMTARANCCIDRCRGWTQTAVRRSLRAPFTFPQ